MDNTNSRLPVPVRLPVRRPERTPALWQQAAPVVVRGAALVAVGLIGEWLVRSAARRALNGTHDKKLQKGRALARREEPHPEAIISVSETIVMTHRRIIARR
jgi:hypothetical protein